MQIWYKKSLSTEGKNDELLRYLFRVSIFKNLNIMVVKRETEAWLLINNNYILGALNYGSGFSLLESIASFNPFKNPWKWLLPPPFYKRRNWGLERLNNLLQVTQLGSKGAGIQKISIFQKFHACHSFCDLYWWLTIVCTLTSVPLPCFLCQFKFFHPLSSIPWNSL